MTKFVSKDGENLGHCPYCRGIVFKDFKNKNNGRAGISFIMKCPHCLKLVAVRIDPQRGVTIEAHKNSD